MSTHTPRCKLVVIGGGVSGIATAVILAENARSAGRDDVEVEVVAERFTPNTTSDGSGGIWSAHFDSMPKGSELERRLREWATETWHHAMGLYQSPEASKAGIQMLPYYRMSYRPENQADHWWADLALDYRRLSDKQRTAMFPGTKDGYVFTSLLTDCTVYLPYLMDRLLKSGGKISQRRISSLHEMVGECDVLVNCCGLGARDLVSDGTMVPLRGQTIQVIAPWVHHAMYIDSESPSSRLRTYVIPRSNDVILGGTKDRLPERVNETDRETILRDVFHFMPSLKNAKIKGDWVGLRPMRKDGVRLETETIHNKGQALQVVHNYGHGAQGVTLHWGCAQEAARLAEGALQKCKGTSGRLSKL